MDCDSLNIEDVEKIAVLRANKVGDFVVALPALAALRAAYPSAEIVLLGRRWHARFLANRPSPVDRVLVVPPSPGLNDDPPEAGAPQLDCFFAAARAEQFDLAIQLHGGGRHSNPFVRNLGARLTIGLKAADAVPLDRWVPYFVNQPEVFRYLEVVSLAGARAVSLEPSVCVTEEDLRASRAVVPEDGSPLAVLNPGCMDPRRQWPAERFGQVGRLLAERGATVAINGSHDEADLAAAVASMIGSQVVNVAGRLSLGGLCGLLSRCRLIVTNDTGPAHLAVAVGAPTVSIFWCGNLINYGPLTRSRHRPLVSWQVHCPRCGRSLCDECGVTSSLVTDVTAEDVAREALDLLGRPAALTAL